MYVPVTGRATEPTEGGEPEEGEQAAGPVLVEYFGHVSFVRPEDGEPGDLRASADFTDVTAEDNPDWKIDLSDDVIGAWRAEGDRGGDITLVWGLPLVRGAVAATAELDGEVLDQARRPGRPVHAGRRRRRARLRRRALPGGPPLGPHPAPDRRREPLRRGRLTTAAGA